MSSESLEIKQNTKLKFRRLECPFDLEQVLQISYSSQGLKSVLEFILDHLGELKAMTSDTEELFAQLKKTPIRPKSCQHFTTKCNCDHQRGVGLDDFAQLVERCNDLEEKSEVLDQRQKDDAANNEQDHLNMVMATEANSQGLGSINNEELPKIWAAIKDLQSRPVAVEGKQTLQTVVQTEKVDLSHLDELFASKKSPDLTIVRLEELEKQVAEINARYNANVGNVGNEPDGCVSNDVTREKNETFNSGDGHGQAHHNCQGHDGEPLHRGDLAQRVARLENSEEKQNARMTKIEEDLANLRNEFNAMLDQMGKGDKIDAGAIMMKIAQLSEELKTKTSRSDLDSLKFELMKYADRGDAENKKNMEKHFDDLRHMIQQLRAEFEQHVQSDFANLVGRVTVIEKKLAQLAASMNKGPTTVVAANNDDELKRLAELLAMLQNDVNNLKVEMQNGFAELANALERKADRDELKDLERRFMDQINDLVNVLSKKFADKAQNKKEHQDMERQIRNLYDIIMSKGGQNNEDDAMFTKKPFAGLSCASCEKDIINMYGKRVEYMPWGKMPFRDPSERIARVGQGFSKMLSMLKPDSLSRYDASKMPPEMVQQQSNLPPMQDGSNMYVPDDHRKTHSRFPNPNSRMVVNSEKRPGSAQAQRHMAARAGRGKQQ